MTKFTPEKESRSEIGILKKDLLLGMIALILINTFTILSPMTGWEFTNSDTFKVIDYLTKGMDVMIIAVGIGSLFQPTKNPNESN